MLLKAYDNRDLLIKTFFILIFQTGNSNYKREVIIYFDKVNHWK